MSDKERNPLHLRLEVPPLDPEFDRRGIADDHYIELLLFEIKELKAALNHKDEEIAKLRQDSTSNNPISTAVTSIEVPPSDVPQRSARRERFDTERINEKRDERDEKGEKREEKKGEKREEKKGEKRDGKTEDPDRSVSSIALKNTSNASFSNYKSRIKLPPTLQAQGANETETKTPAKDVLSSPTETIERRGSVPETRDLPDRLRTKTRRSSDVHPFAEIARPSEPDKSEHSTPKSEPSVETSPLKISTQVPPLPPAPLTLPPTKQLPSSSSPTSAVPLLPETAYTHVPVFASAKPNNTTTTKEDHRDGTGSDPRAQDPGDYFSHASPDIYSPPAPHKPAFRSPRIGAPAVPGTPETFSGRLLNDEVRVAPVGSNVSIVSPQNTTHDFDDPRTPVNNSFMSMESLRPQTPGLSFNVIHTPKPEDNIALFVKPEDFHTIAIVVVSTISMQTKRTDDPNFTLRIDDRESRKEMWRIRKTYSQLMAFDNEIRPIVDCFGLPALPERSLFGSTSPSKVDGRREMLQNYFNSIFVMPHIPQLVLYRICRYLSLDFVNPLDDYRSGAAKEGFLIRRYKTIGTTWKVRWCQVDGPSLEIYDSPGGTLLEQVRLRGTQIGRQSSDSVAEDKGYRHAFLILETTKASKLSSYSKHFFCAESDEERDSWIESLLEFSDAETADTSIVSQEGVLETPANRFDYQDDLEHASKPYSTLSLTPGSAANDLESTSTTYSEEKKLKKRSLFPFRYRNHDGDSVPETPVVAQIEEEDALVLLSQMNLDKDVNKAIFGRDIEQAFELSSHKFLGRPIPSIVFRCLDFLTRTGGVYEEGIFRLSGSASTIKQLKVVFNASLDVDLFTCDLKPDMHTVAGLLKTYLRELPNPILGHDAYKYVQTLVGTTPLKEALAYKVRDYLAAGNVDAIHYDMCFVMFKFLRQIIANHASNRMNLRNVCIVFVPTLNMSLDVLLTFLVDFDCIFEGGDPVASANRETLDLQIPNF